MTATLPLIQIKEFLKLATFVEVDDLIIANNPVYGHIKIDVIMNTCFLTKSSPYKFISYNFETECEDCSLLVFEGSLISFCNVSNKPSIKINNDSETTLILSDEYYSPEFGKITNLGVYPKIPKAQQEIAKLDKNIIELMKMTKEYVGDDKVRPFIQHLHFKNNILFATNAQATIVNNLPNLISEKLIPLSKSDCDLITSFDNVEFYLSDSGFRIFKNKNCTYGSRGVDGISDVVDLILVYQNNVNISKYIKISVNDFKNFTESTIKFISNKINKSKAPTFKNSVLSILNDGEVSLNYEDELVKNKINISAQIVGFNKGFSIIFNHTIMSKVLNNLPPYRDICISDTKDGSMFGLWFIKDDGTRDNTVMIICSKQTN